MQELFRKFKAAAAIAMEAENWKCACELYEREKGEKFADKRENCEPLELYIEN